MDGTDVFCLQFFLNKYYIVLRLRRTYKINLANTIKIEKQFAKHLVSFRQRFIHELCNDIGLSDGDESY